MTAWLEVDRVGADARGALAPWQRFELGAALWLSAAPDLDDPRVVHLALAPSRGSSRTGAAVLDVSRAGARWMLRPHVADVVRNGVALQQGERYPLENGDRVEALPGTWLRFLDDSVPQPLPRLRQVGRVFLFAPDDDGERWRALLPDRDDVLLAVRVHDGDDDALRRAFPEVVDVLGTPAGRFALLAQSAGVPLAALLRRTRREGALLAGAVVEAIGGGAQGALNHALQRGWLEPSLFTHEVSVTWEGRVRWWGFVRFAADREEALDSALRELHAHAEPARPHRPARAGDEAGADVLAGLLAHLFPEERAAELRLREEVALWTRADLAALALATRGRP